MTTSFSQGPITKIVSMALDKNADKDCGLTMARKLIDAVPGTVTQVEYAKFCSAGVRIYRSDGGLVSGGAEISPSVNLSPSNSNSNIVMCIPHSVTG